MEKKNPLKSKTLWLNFIAAALALFYPPAQEWIATHPDAVVAIVSGVNMLLRLITKEKIGLEE